MAKCILDLTNVGKYGNTLGYDVPYTMAESVIIDSVGQIEPLIYQLTHNGPPVGFLPQLTEFVLIDPDVYPNEPGNLDIYTESHNMSSVQWLRSLIDPLNPQLLKASKPIDRGVHVVDLLTTLYSTGTSADSNGRFNLADVGGDKCFRGFYGLIADKIESVIPKYEICYVPRTKENADFLFSSGIRFPFLFTATRIGDIIAETYSNRRGPIIISDEISVRSGKGISIVDDLAACPPPPAPDPGIFDASDIDFGEVESGLFHKKDVFIYNRTIPTPPNTGQLRLLDMTPKQHPNFEILDFNNGYGYSPLMTSPLNISSANPLLMDANSNLPFSFGVKYNPNDEFGVLHQMEITYLVETNTQTPQPVTQEKLTTRITGKSYKTSVTCSDVDWGRIDVYNITNPQDITIKNTGTRDVYLYGYELIESTGTTQNFTFPFPLTASKQNPITIEPNNTFNITVNYNPRGIVDSEHSARIKFNFAYNHPTIGNLGGEVTGTKLISYLKGIGYSDPIDDIIDDITDIVTDDENGVFVTKTLSSILDKSVVVQKNRTFPLWNCGSDRLHEIFTGSNGAKSDSYYLPIYSDSTNQSNSTHEFDISYGHVNGSGSSYYDNTNLAELYPSKTMYRKYLTECYGNLTGSVNFPKKFKFKNGVESDSVYFIQLDRNLFRDMLDPGNFELSFVPLSSSLNQLYNTGSNFYVNTSSSVVYKLIDDSFDTKQDRTDRSGLDSFYYIVSGSLQQGIYGEPTDNAWGMVFPKMGLIVLDGNVLDQSCSFNTVTGSFDGDNIYKLFLSLSGSLSVSDARPVSESMFARSAEKMLIQTYFCRANPNEFNYSNNPTYVSGPMNSMRYEYFVKDPKTYITTIGLYNKKNELLAVGKLKKPVLKTDRTQYVFQVRVRIF